MKSKIEKELNIKAPKTTIEKNICMKLGRSESGLSIKDLARSLDESEGFLSLLLPVMVKNGLISLLDGKYYLQIPMQF